MKLPLVLEPSLGPEEVRNFHSRIVPHSPNETIWGRHQLSQNRQLSKWRSSGDRRKRSLHVVDEFTLVGTAFCLKSCYLAFSICNTRDRVEEYRQAFEEAQLVGGWHNGERGDLRVDCACRAVDEEYWSFAATVCSRDFPVTPALMERPERVFQFGVRKPKPRGKPEYVSPADLLRWLPCQLMVGSGPSLEAGVSPLHSLHEIYGVCKHDYEFIFDAAEDGVVGFLARPEEKYREALQIYIRILKAPLTEFHRVVARMAQQGLVIPPVISTNFDALVASAGVREESVRSFAPERVYPQVSFAAGIRSLWVVGYHADRRFILEQARARGLKVVFIDPEHYAGEDYPLEAPQDGDLILRASATEAFRRLAELCLP